LIVARNIFLAFCILFFSRCDKGYQVRFTNYYIEAVDTVKVGDTDVRFTTIPTEYTTDFQPVKRGRHHLEIITRSGKRFFGVMAIPSNGSGNRTIQIDGINQISILEE
jgi:hypothetical protein